MCEGVCEGVCECAHWSGTSSRDATVDDDVVVVVVEAPSVVVAVVVEAPSVVVAVVVEAPSVAVVVEAPSVAVVVAGTVLRWGKYRAQHCTQQGEGQRGEGRK